MRVKHFHYLLLFFILLFELLKLSRGLNISTAKINAAKDKSLNITPQ